MNQRHQNTIYKWTFRFRYIYILIIGAGLLSIGFSIGLGFEKISKQPSLNVFIAGISSIFGIIFIILGFYIKNDIEKNITKLNL